MIDVIEIAPGSGGVLGGRSLRIIEVTDHGEPLSGEKLIITEAHVPSIRREVVTAANGQYTYDQDKDPVAGPAPRPFQVEVRGETFDIP